MAEFTFTLTDKTIQKLTEAKDKYNQMNKTSHTLEEWMTLVLKDMAIGEEMALAVEIIAKQQEATKEAEKQAAFETKRQELLAALDK